MDDMTLALRLGEQLPADLNEAWKLSPGSSGRATIGTAAVAAARAVYDQWVSVSEETAWAQACWAYNGCVRGMMSSSEPQEAPKPLWAVALDEMRSHDGGLRDQTVTLTPKEALAFVDHYLATAARLAEAERERDEARDSLHRCREDFHAKVLGLSDLRRQMDELHAQGNWPVADVVARAETAEARVDALTEALQRIVRINLGIRRLCCCGA